jgi:hypothetical protein
VHDLDLRIALLRIFLVDTQLVYPQRARSFGVAQGYKSFSERYGDLEKISVAFDAMLAGW